VPSAVVVLDAIPRTPNGKIDRRALPAPGRPHAPATPTAPANEVEEKIAAVWRELLDLDRIGINDNFFDLGANSLLVMQSVGKLATALGQSLSLVDTLRFTTVRSLAAHVGGAAGDGPSLKESGDRAEQRRAALEQRREQRLRLR
jgi:acyl carrier protein